MKITPRKKRQHAAGREKNDFSLPAASPFLAWGDFHAHSCFARSTISEEKWGTTRSLKLAEKLGVSKSLIFLYGSYILWKIV